MERACSEEEELYLRELPAGRGTIRTARPHVCELAGVLSAARGPGRRRHVHPLWLDRLVIRPPGSTMTIHPPATDDPTPELVASRRCR